MKLAGIRAGDVVLIDQGGRLAYAIVTSVGERELEYDPVTRGWTWTQANARQVVGHWSKRGRAQRGR